MNIDRAKYIDTGLVTERAHPSEPYLIYNYTPLCQFSKAWDDVTMQCRGLILHRDTGEVIARPFKKFFNLEEHIANGGVIPEDIPQVFDKRDGSLGILYWGIDGTPYIATRGSFTSDQAMWATEFLRERFADLSFCRAYTYLFEIIYPQNRVVVDYGIYEGLDLLAIIDTQTGQELLFDHDCMDVLGTPTRSIPFTNFAELKQRNTKNSEGFVLRYHDGLRLKIKFEEYVRLHKIMTGLSEIGLWEMLSQGKKIEQIVANIPDEMHAWANMVVGNLLDQFNEIERTAKSTFDRVKKMKTRKHQADVVKKLVNPGIVFAMLDDKDYSKIIWKMIRPHGSSTFRKDIDV